MDKILTYPGKTDKGVFAFVIDEEKGYLTKTASEYHPTIAAYINNAKSIPGETQLLITALGAGEYWGDNSNSDYFGEDQLAYDGPEYGFRTFELYARLYKHHVNKPNSQHYGRVILSVYNPTYHRVELIIGVDHALAPDVIANMERGEYPVFSMGTKIPYDICNTCGNKAPNRKYYCEHLRYALGMFDPKTGRKNFAINIKPKFFDISIVVIPADKTALTLKKVASHHLILPDYLLDGSGRILGSAEAAEKQAESKSAALAKLSEIDKEIPASDPPASVDLVNNERARHIVRTAIETMDREPMLPPHILDKMCSIATLPEIMSTMHACMIAPKPQEFQRIILVTRGMKDVADRLDSANACFDPTSYKGPHTQELQDELGLDESNIREDLADILAPYFSQRSNTAPLLVKRMTLMVKQADVYNRPQYYNPPKEESSSKLPSGVIPSLALGAAMYSLLTPNSWSSSFLLKLIDKHPLIMASLGVGLLRAATKNTPDPVPYRGRFSGTEPVTYDSTDTYERIERMRERPYLKVAEGEEKTAGPNAAMLRRLLIGVPAVHMASGFLQRHRDTHPNEEEGKITGFIRKHPTLISGVLVADALLARHGKGSYMLTKPIVDAQKSWLSGAQLLKSAGIVAEESHPNVKSASVQDYLTSSLVWPTVIGGANLPGRIVGSLFDQAALDIGGKLIEKSQQRKMQKAQKAQTLT